VTTSSTSFDAVLDWLRKGYPEGVPTSDYFPLLALLKRDLSEEQITKVILTVAREHGLEHPFTEEQIIGAIATVTEQSPNPEEINQVASRLAAAGWPLASAN